MKQIVLVIVLLVLMFNVVNVKADSLFNKHDTVTGSKANSHVLPEKHHKSQCSNDGIPELSAYLDGDTPTDIAYSDYLEDLQWFSFWYPNHCDIVPESLGG